VKEERDAGGLGAKPPPGPVKLLISGGFQAPTGAELPPPLERKQNLSPPPRTNS